MLFKAVKVSSYTVVGIAMSITGLVGVRLTTYCAVQQIVLIDHCSVSLPPWRKC